MCDATPSVPRKIITLRVKPVKPKTVTESAYCMVTSQITLEIGSYDSDLQPLEIYHAKKYAAHKSDLVKLIQSSLPNTIHVHSPVFGHSQITVSITYSSEQDIILHENMDACHLFDANNSPVFVKLWPINSPSYESREKMPFPQPCRCC
jgi:hypothetical protein